VRQKYNFDDPSKIKTFIPDIFIFLVSRLVRIRHFVKMITILLVSGVLLFIG